MAFAFKGQGGIAASKVANQQTTPLTTATTAGAIGDLAVLCVAVDNNAITDGDENAVTSVSSPGNTWLKAKEFTNGQAALQAGATVSIWFCNVVTAMPIGTVITINFGDPPARDASAITLGYFSEASNYTAIVEASGQLANDAVAVGSLNVTTSNIACLRIRATASEGSTATLWTKTAAFTGLFTQAVTSGGATAVNQGIRAEYLVSTSTGQASIPTGGAGATDHASIYVAFREVITQTLTFGSTYVDPDVFHNANIKQTFISTPDLMQDTDVIFASASTNVNLLLPYTYNNADNIFFSAVAYGAIALDAASVIDQDEILSTVVTNNARSEIGFVEDDDTFYDPDVSTIWIVFNTHVDSDDFTNDTEIHNVNYIRHVGGFSIEEIIPPSTLHMSHAVSAVFIADDDIFGVDTLSQVEFDPSRVMSPDSFFVITLFTDFIFTTPPVPSDDVFYIPAITAVTGSVQNITPGRYVDTLESIRQPSIGKGPVYMSPSHVAADTTIFAADTSSIQLRPILVVDNDTIRTTIVTKGAVTLQPTKYADTDNILTPMISQDPQHSELYDDTDLFIPPYMARLRGVRTGVGVIRGRVDNVNYLTGHRDTP